MITQTRQKFRKFQSFRWAQLLTGSSPARKPAGAVFMASMLRIGAVLRFSVSRRFVGDVVVSASRRRARKMADFALAGGKTSVSSSSLVEIAAVFFKLCSEEEEEEHFEVASIFCFSASRLLAEILLGLASGEQRNCAFFLETSTSSLLPPSVLAVLVLLVHVFEIGPSSNSSPP